MKKIRVALVHNIISPYRVPVFNALAKKRDVDLTVFFLSESARNRQWNTRLYKKHMHFKYKILNNTKIIFPFKEPVEYIINFTIFHELAKKKYDVVITSGWADFACQIIPFLKNVYHYKFILWAGSTKDEPSLQRTLTLPLVKKIVIAADHIVAYGSKAKDYLISLGASTRKISSTVNAVDVAYFKKQAKLMKRQKLARVRKQYSLLDVKRSVLYVGQFIERKNVEMLIKAMSLLKVPDVTLILLGYGPRKKIYLQLAKKMDVDIRVINHVELENIPNIYSLSDVLVLPSREEVWGLVVNEAMAVGLPVIVSNKSGCINDLIFEGKNGFSFHHDNEKELAEKINLILTNSDLKKRMGRESQKIISRITPAKTAAVFYQEIKKLVK